MHRNDEKPVCTQPRQNYQHHLTRLQHHHSERTTTKKEKIFNNHTSTEKRSKPSRNNTRSTLSCSYCNRADKMITCVLLKYKFKKHKKKYQQTNTDIHGSLFVLPMLIPLPILEDYSIQIPILYNNTNTNTDLCILIHTFTDTNTDIRYVSNSYRLFSDIVSNFS